MKNIDIIIKIVMATLFLICLADLPYGYYQLVRFFGFIGFGYLAYLSFEKENRNWTVIFAISALLINPFFKIALGRTLWNIVDVIWALLLVFSILKSKPTNTE
jgi:hypothetical protein